MKTTFREILGNYPDALFVQELYEKTSSLQNELPGIDFDSFNNNEVELCKYLADNLSEDTLNKEISVRYILKTNGATGALWLFDQLSDEKTMHLFISDVAESVLHIFEEKYPEDKRPRQAIQARRDFVVGKIGKEGLDKAITSTYVSYVAASNSFIGSVPDYAHFVAAAATAKTSYTAAYYAVNCYSNFIYHKTKAPKRTWCR